MSAAHTTILRPASTMIGAFGFRPITGVRYAAARWTNRLSVHGGGDVEKVRLLALKQLLGVALDRRRTEIARPCLGLRVLHPARQAASR